MASIQLKYGCDLGFYLWPYGAPDRQTLAETLDARGDVIGIGIAPAAGHPNISRV